MKKNNFFKYTFIFFIFLIFGFIVGVFGTQEYMASIDKKEEEEEIVAPTKKIEIVDISSNGDYKELINTLYAYLNRNPVYYNSNGFDITTADPETKLSILYSYLVSNKLDKVETVPAGWDGMVCPINEGANSFIVDGDGSTKLCTVSNLSVASLKELYAKLFGDTGFETPSIFYGNDRKLCVLVGESYLCGRTTGGTFDGSLQPKMEVLKVEKYGEDIVFTEKGYLLDTRSNVKVTDENYYLHSSDSTDYYHELKSSENLYFIHTFAHNPDGTYTYLKTIVQTKKDK